MRNQYKLSRDIPESVKSIIRKRDAFGCVLCGKGIYTYEHFDPEFKDAIEHNPSGMALLCFQCQGKKTKHLISKESVEQAVLKPKCREQGFSNDFFELKFPIIVHLGNIVVRADKSKVVLTLSGEKSISIDIDDQGGPMQLSGIFRNEKDDIYLTIDKNEWVASVENLDIKQTKNHLEIHTSSGEMKTIITANPPHELIFEYLDLFHNGTKLHFDKINGGRIIIKHRDEKERDIYTEQVQIVNSINIA